MDTAVLINENLSLLFVLATIISVILAYGAHFFLSLLSIATGVSLTPNLKKSFAEYKADKNRRNDRSERNFNDYEDDEDDDDDGLDSVMITSSIGLWVLLTSSIALFLGTFLGFSFLKVADHMVIVAGLVVWSLFFFSLMYLEYKAVNSIMGGLFQTALSGVRNTTKAAGSIISRSQSSQIEKNVRKSTRAIYDEITRSVKKDNLDNKLEDYIGRITPEIPDMKDIRKELYDFFDKLEVEERLNIEDSDILRILDVHINDESSLNKENLQKVRSQIEQGKDKAGQHKSKSRKIIAILDHIAPVEDEKSVEIRQKISDILNRTSKDELNAEEFEKDLELAFDDPKAAKDQVIGRMKHFDRNTIKEIVNDLSDLPQEKSDKYVDMAYNALSKLQSKTAETHRSSFAAYKNAPNTIEQKIRTYFDGMGQESLRYSQIKNDVQSIMEEPTSAPAVIKQRLLQLDENGIAALLSANPIISQEQGEKLAAQIISAKSGAVSTLDEVNKQFEKSQRRAVVFAEKARKNTITASWWLVLSSLFSALAAILGVYLSNIFY